MNKRQMTEADAAILTRMQNEFGDWLREGLIDKELYVKLSKVLIKNIEEGFIQHAD